MPVDEITRVESRLREVEAKAEEQIRRANFHELRAERAEDDIHLLLRKLMQQGIEADVRAVAGWDSSIDWMQRALDAENRIRKSKRFIAACTLSTDKDLHRLGVQLNQNLQAFAGQDKAELDERLAMSRADAVAKKHRVFLKEQDEQKRKGAKPKKTVVSSGGQKEKKVEAPTDDESSAAETMVGCVLRMRLRMRVFVRSAPTLQIAI